MSPVRIAFCRVRSMRLPIGMTMLALLLGMNSVIKAQCHVRSARVVSLPDDGWMHMLAPGNTPDGPVSMADIESAECLLEPEVERWNKQSPPDHQIHLERYYRQYCSLIDSTGHHLIYLNALCDTDGKEDWKSRWILVFDGGSCYFQVLFDMTTGKILRFSVNGLA